MNINDREGQSPRATINLQDWEMELLRLQSLVSLLAHSLHWGVQELPIDHHKPGVKALLGCYDLARILEVDLEDLYRRVEAASLAAGGSNEQ